MAQNINTVNQTEYVEAISTGLTKAATLPTTIADTPCNALVDTEAPHICLSD